MARFDTATLAFLDKLAEEDSGQTRHHSVGKDVALAAKKVIRIAQHPTTNIPRALVGLATKELIKEGSITALGLFDVLNTNYEKDWWDWEPETIWRTLSVEQGIETSPEIRDMVLALQLAVNTNQPFEHWHIFEKVGNALNGNEVDFRILQPLELDDAAATVQILKKIRPATGFDEEIPAYIASIAKTSGIVFLPPELFTNECQAYLDSLNNDLLLRDQVSKRWPSREKKDDTPALKIQLMQLHEIKEYVDKMLRG